MIKSKILKYIIFIIISICAFTFWNVNKNLFLRVVPTVCGFACLMGGLILIPKVKKRMINYNKINGKVVELRKELIGESLYFFPNIEYIDLLTKEKRIYKSNAGRMPSKYSVGQIIELRYIQLDDKVQVCIDSWFDVWGTSFLLLLLGSMITFLGLLFNLLS